MTVLKQKRTQAQARWLRASSNVAVTSTNAANTPYSAPAAAARRIPSKKKSHKLLARAQIATAVATFRKVATSHKAATSSAAPTAAASSLSLTSEREVTLTAQLLSLQTEIATQRRTHDNEVHFAVGQALRKIQAMPPLLLSRSVRPSTAQSTATAASASAATDSKMTMMAFTAPDNTNAASLSVLPAHWPEHQSHHVTLSHVKKTDPEWAMVQNMLSSTGAVLKAGLLSVQRIYNRPLFDRYVAARERVMLKSGNEALNTAASMGNEQLMWHGTRSHSPHLIYANADGFDVRMSGAGMLGSGSYFSRLASYSGGSYAHLVTQSGGGGGSGSRGSSHAGRSGAAAAVAASSSKHPVDPSLFEVTPQGKLQPIQVPSNTFQMFLAKVVLGTEYQCPHGGHYSGRPPIRVFHCPSCKTAIDLPTLSLDTLRTTLHVGGGAAGSVTEAMDAEARTEEQTEEALGDSVPTKVGKRGNGGKGKGKRKRVGLSVPSPPAASAATSTSAAGSESVDNSRKRGRTTRSTVLASASLVTSAAAAAATTSAIATTQLSFAEMPVSCHQCNTCIGTRASLLAHPYRYDSVTQGHMSAVYESDRAYPEFLVTYTINQ